VTSISRRRFLKGTFAVGAGALVSVFSDGSYKLAFAQGRGPVRYRLQVLHTNDHHARIEPVPASTTAPVRPSHGGVARRKTLIDQFRAAAAAARRPLVLLDAGDVFQGTLYYNQYKGQADLEFYNAMGYDAMTIGNHEYDNGQQPLAEFILGANFPVLSANTVVDASSPLSGLIRAGTIVERGGKKIGIFGLTTPDTVTISNPGPGISFTDVVEAAKEQVKALRRAGAEIIIALTHIGYENDVLLARSVDQINLIIGGHSHTPMAPMDGVTTPVYPVVERSPGGNRVVIVQDWEWGRWLGNLTLSFNNGGEVVGVEGAPAHVLATVTPDAAFEERVAFYKAPLDLLLQLEIGVTDVFLDGERNNVRSRETNLGSLIAEAMLAQARFDGAQIAITNGGGIRASINVGPVTVGEVLTVLPFGNTLARADLTGAQLKTALEQGVRNYVVGSASPAGNFPQVAGIRFRFDPALPAGSRVTELTLADGTPVSPAATYRVVTNNFMLAGGDGFVAFTEGANRFDYGFVMADEVMDYIGANSPITAGTDGRIAIGPAPVGLRTAPAAAQLVTA
jgi:5'-nucleotidase